MIHPLNIELYLVFHLILPQDSQRSLNKQLFNILLQRHYSACGLRPYNIVFETCLEDTIANFLVSFSRALIGMVYECFTMFISFNNTL